MIPWKEKLIPILPILLTASAGQAENIDAKDRAAKKACLAGNFADGVAILSELYVSSGDPTFIFNQGRCFEQNHRYEDAIARFREYLRVAKRPSKTDRARAQAHITDCEGLLAKQVALQSKTRPASAPTGASGIEAKEKAAMKACLTGDAASGVAILTDLFIETKDTTYLFNQGRCFEQNRQYEEAVGRFREYLIKTKDLRPDHKADTEKHILACESYLQGKSTGAAKSEPTAGTESRPAPEPRTGQVVAIAPNRSLPEGGAGLRIAGVTVAAAGAAGMVAGLVLNLKANKMSDDLEGLYDPGVESSRDRYETAGWIAYGAGAACVATGALLYYFGWRRSQASASVALLPTVGPDANGLPGSSQS
jgi:TolA-binding protein